MFEEKAKGNFFNLGNPDERTVLDLAKLIKTMTSSNSNIVFEDLPQDDPLSRKPDISKAKDILGWEPNVSIKEGLQKTIEYFKNVKNL